ncbi:hypothetical protein R5R35_012246 [Gryllus longicercus]|uniref:NADH dehydrogenase [ubiquinone] 1 beta subcomplex subunit 5, mitochondrial n=1 Tax=Gryllus longicercus TaxID=2509291 RepID=A0AAN9YYH4_9ORTH
MVAWSCLKTLFRTNNLQKYVVAQRGPQSPDILGHRFMSEHRTMTITPSRWQWHKFKDLLHYYLMVGLIPVGLIVFYANVFIGPAQLAEIPEGYVPKHWEYHQHPITRFFARYVTRNPQQEYEKFLHFVYEEQEKKQLRILEKEIKRKMAERHDYQAYYYRPVTGKYSRVAKESADKIEELTGN